MTKPQQILNAIEEIIRLRDAHGKDWDDAIAPVIDNLRELLEAA